MSGFLLQLSRQDERALHALVRTRRQAGDRLMKGVTHLGDAWVVILASLALAMGILPGWEDVGLRIGFAVASSHLAVQLLKRIINRPRPRLPIGHSLLIEAPDRFSFPSGHAAASLSFALPVAGMLSGFTGFVVLSIALLVGVSRCYLGVHYPGDVLMGWLLGVAGSAIAVPVLSLLL